MLSQPAGTPAEAVAFTIVPGVEEQLVAEVNVVAPLQSSFEGGPTVIEKPSPLLIAEDPAE